MLLRVVNRSSSDTAFLEACEKIEKIKGIEKEESLVDFDGSKVQPYRLNGKKIVVVNDIDEDAVYVRSEEDLGSILK